MTLARLAVHELWLSFRLFLLVTAFVAAGAIVVLLPASVSAAFDGFALWLGIASAAAAVIGAWSLAAARRNGHVGWLVSRTVPRGLVLVGWFGALAGLSLVGIAAAAFLAWPALGATAASPEPVVFLACMLAAACGTLALVAIGLVAGTGLPSPAAGVATLAAAALVTAATLAAPSLALFLPAAGHELLASLPARDAVLGRAVLAAGVNLLTTALVLLAGRALLGRVDL
jgi:hypothetical protein